ncbi:MAG TPA: Uma2 family endonuclease [Tepidisphaeraceae bacterium]
MTLADIDLDPHQHFVLEDVSWEFYEHLLEEVADGHTRVTYCDGSLEMMSPLPKHDRTGFRIGILIALMCVERDIQYVPGGSTTFRDKAKRIGLEPDGCFFLTNGEAFNQIEGSWDPAVHPAPDLAIEIEITRKAVAKQPIYGKLGIKELWRYDGKHIHVLLLSESGEYRQSSTSAAFAFLPMQQFEKFLHRFDKESEVTVIRDFQKWVRAMPTES